LSFGFGEAFQFDWSEESMVIGGISREFFVNKKLGAMELFAM